MEQSSDNGTCDWLGHHAWARWTGLLLGVLVVSAAVAGTALATFTAVTAGASGRSDTVAKDRASATSLALDRYLASSAPVLDAELSSAIQAFRPSGSPQMLDNRITAATGASYSMIVWPYAQGSEPGTPSFDNAEVAGNTDAATTDLFQGDISDAQGEPVAGIADLIGTGPAVFAGRQFTLGGKRGYVLISRPLGLKSFDGMGVRFVAEGTLEQRSVPRGAQQLDLADSDMTSVGSVLYVSSDATPTMYVDLEDWDGAGAGRIVLTAPPKAGERMNAPAAQPYLLSMAAAVSVGFLLGVAMMVGFGRVTRPTSASI
jgi:hypothetical protein